MSEFSVQETVVCGSTDGPTLTSAAAASCIPTASKITLPSLYWRIGKAWRLRMAGRISCVVTTPGTARFDVRLGGTVCFDTAAMPLNIVAKTDVPWWLDVTLVCRAAGSGTATTLMGQGVWLSEASINTAAHATGPGPGGQLLPYNSAPAVGGGFDNTAQNSVDVFYTQTVGTAGTSLTVHTYLIESLN